MSKWFNTKYPGVRYREHPSRKFGVRKDRYYAIRYLVDGKRVEESLGWETDWKRTRDGQRTVSLEDEAARRRTELVKNKQEGTGPKTLREQRDENTARRDAEQALERARLQRGITLSDYFHTRYMPGVQGSKKDCSLAKEEQHFRLKIEPLLGAIPIKDIHVEHWEELVRTLSLAGLSQRTKEYVTGTLRRILRHAYEKKVVDEPPPTGKRVGVSGPGNNRRLRVITNEEEAAIMGYLAGIDIHAWRLTRFAFLTGCRASEAFNLTWGYVNTSLKTITFPRTKNGNSRTLPITKPIAEIFDGMPVGLPGARVFTKKDGNPYTQAPSAFLTVIENLGFNDGHEKRNRLVFHSIRHTTATRLARKLEMRELMDVMGWQTVQMAMRYVHGDDEAKASALAALGATTEQGGNVLLFRKSSVA